MGTAHMDVAVSGVSDLQSQPVTSLRGVGPRVAQRLLNLGIETVQDLLFHLPSRYQDRTHVVPMGSLRPGDEAVVEGVVDLVEIKFGRKRMLLVRIADGTGALTLRFFHFNGSQQAGFARGTRLRCYGEVRPGAATLEMIHPEYRRVEAGVIEPAEEHLTPIYPTTAGMHQLTLRALTDQALERLAQAGESGLRDWLPPELLKQFKLPSIAAAIRYVHRPPPEASVASLEAGRHPAQQRLVFEELLAHHLSLRQLRHAAKAQCAPLLQGTGTLRDRFVARLPFALTDAQRRVVAEIESDLVRNHPMLRLVQGDVGSGKTVVAALAALQAVEAGAQVAVMAPTELLAEQHYRNFREWLVPLDIEVVWLSGKSKGKAREAAIAALAEDRAAIAIGTHALFQEDVQFARLGLVIVDEQHRFGVHQRLALRDKGRQGELHPHQLTMTATPIPRTLAMTVYADLDASIIDELPPGRTPVQTVVIPDSRRPEIVERVREACAQGRQAYWVCTLIEESEALQCQAAADTAGQLAAALHDLRVGLVHGRMKPRDKEAVMTAFKAHEIDLLVATTVIEVGVDVPNASLMIIENAERLGLAQLHQLRGRVGRGAAHSSCVLMYHGPLSAQARARLGVLRDTTDGFEIARRDLEQRGPGEVLGTRQTGLLSLRIADLVRDQAQLPAVERAAERLLADYPEHAAPLICRWLADAGRYGQV